MSKYHEPTSASRLAMPSKAWLSRNRRSASLRSLMSRLMPITPIVSPRSFRYGALVARNVRGPAGAAEVSSLETAWPVATTRRSISARSTAPSLLMMARSTRSSSALVLPIDLFHAAAHEPRQALRCKAGSGRPGPSRTRGRGCR